MSLISHSAEWAALTQHQQSLAQTSMRELFAANPLRFEQFSLQLDGLLFDFSKHRITSETKDLLLSLAKQAGLPEWMQALKQGETVNRSEGRAALHHALRFRPDSGLPLTGDGIHAKILAVRQQMRQFVQAIRCGERLGYDGQAITDLVHIGIGGSDLGPRLAAEALRPFLTGGPRLHFVANLDGGELARTLAGLNPATTLFAVVSKTFTTLETATNAQSARNWLLQSSSAANVSQHFVAITTNRQAAEQFGVAPENIFAFWEWVGGRYSVWSAVGLSLACGLGWEGFEAFLEGAAAMDAHYFNTPLDQNLPVLMALLSIWYISFWGAESHALVPYDDRLARFPAYLQQMDMESNGKRVSTEGVALDHASGAIIWGEVGSNSQHAFFQLLHQSQRLVPIDFIVSARPSHSLPDHHPQLVANCLAQSEALMWGKTEAEVRAELRVNGLPEEEIERLTPHKVCPGNQPSSTLLFSELSPYTLGMLMALYEHKICSQAAIWGINPFDQWGVEFGKQLAKKIVPELISPHAATEHDASTNGLIAAYRRYVELSGTSQQ